MKTSIKKIFKRLPLMAAILAAGICLAQKSIPNIHVSNGGHLVANSWFVYTGNNTASDRANAANYTKVDSPPSCSGSNNLCSINAPESASDQDRPDLTGMTSSIESAVSNHTSTADIKLQN